VKTSKRARPALSHERILRTGKNVFWQHQLQSESSKMSAPGSRGAKAAADRFFGVVKVSGTDHLRRCLAVMDPRVALGDASWKGFAFLRPAASHSANGRHCNKAWKEMACLRLIKLSRYDWGRLGWTPSGSCPLCLTPLYQLSKARKRRLFFCSVLSRIFFSGSHLLETIMRLRLDFALWASNDCSSN